MTDSRLTEAFADFPDAIRSRALRADLETHPGARVDELISLFEVFARYFAILAFSDFVHLSGPEGLDDRVAARLETQFKDGRQTLGSWLGLLDDLDRARGDADRSILADKVYAKVKSPAAGKLSVATSRAIPAAIEGGARRLGPGYEAVAASSGKSLSWLQAVRVLGAFRNGIRHRVDNGWDSLVDLFGVTAPLFEQALIETVGSAEIRSLLHGAPVAEVVAVQEELVVCAFDLAGRSQHLRVDRRTATEAVGDLAVGDKLLLRHEQGQYGIYARIHDPSGWSAGSPRARPPASGPRADRAHPAPRRRVPSQLGRRSEAAQESDDETAPRRQPSRRILLAAGLAGLVGFGAIAGVIWGRAGDRDFDALIGESRPGPFPSRATYRCGTVTNLCKAADHVVFNAYSNNPETGDERRFLSVSGPRSTERSADTMTVQDRDEVWVRALVNNAGEPNRSDHVATGTRLRLGVVRVPRRFSWRVVALLSADNAKPEVIGDDVSLHSDRALRIAYIPGSARAESASGGSLPLDDAELLEGRGALLGHGRADGRWPAGFQWAGYVTARYSVVSADPSPSTARPPTAPRATGALPGGDFFLAAPGTDPSSSRFSNRARARCGSAVTLTARIRNSGPERLDSVRVGMPLPEGVADSASIEASVSADTSNPPYRRDRASVEFERPGRLSMKTGSARLLDAEGALIESLPDAIASVGGATGVAVGGLDVGEPRYVELVADVVCSAP